MQYTSYEDNNNTGIIKEERIGVIHLVSGWIQQAQPQKVNASFQYHILY